MIGAGDFYSVMCAMVPLYFAMFVAYGSVRWWKVFTPGQCSGINRFVAVFAVPILSFHFISQNDPYAMDLRFLLADTLSKLFVLLVLSLWSLLLSRSGLDWLITLFSVSTLPNTLVMGIPLLRAMYGHFTQSLMVQLVVLQCIVWYTLLLFLFEYRAATILIRENFPGQMAGSITNIEVDGDVISLDDAGDRLLAESDTDCNGHVRVRIHRSTSRQGSTEASSVTARPSNLSGAEIYSVDTRGSSDAYSLQPTPRQSNFEEVDLPVSMSDAATPVWAKSPVSSGLRVYQPRYSPTANVAVLWERKEEAEEDEEEERQGSKQSRVEKEQSFRSTTKFMDAGDDPEGKEGGQQMPASAVMLKLILTMVGRKLSRNPNTYSSLLGLLWSLVSYKWGVRMPSVATNSIRIISDAGLGMAMFSLGLFMALQPRIVACGGKAASMAMAIRFLCGPAVVAAASVAVRLRGPRLRTAIVQAALPQGIVPFVFAREYALHPDILSTGVIFGMLVSLPVTLVYYILLGL